MKIVHKVIAANIFDIVLIALIGFFAYSNVNLVLTKLHFAEIADDLNASFLEMRLSEKNYFLYEDASALGVIQQQAEHSLQALEDSQEDITRAIGKQNFMRLKDDLIRYQQAISQTPAAGPQKQLIQEKVREAGHELRDFSERITRLERSKVNQIISESRKWLVTALCIFLLSAIGVTHFLSLNVVKSFKKIVKIAHSISEGNFSRVDPPIPDDELGSALRAINSMSDELKNREEQIVQSKKLASIGILTAGVAHELGNPLNNISMMAQAYQELYNSLSIDERLGYMKKIEDETERIQEIVKNLLDFSKPKKAKLREVDLNGVLKKTLKLVQNMIVVSNVNLEVHLTPQLPAVYIDEHQIQEVLINLMTNAVQACSPGDNISVGTGPGTVESMVKVEVADTGKGIPAHLLPNIFDPFFTTKGASGTGLGLSVSYGIVKNHGGSIEVHSEEGKGTIFILELPIRRLQEETHERS
ncbi:MAG: ATP-binding protein [Desulfoferrobacter sp.]